MKHFKAALLALSMAYLLSGCSVDGQIKDMTSTIEMVPLTNVMGLASGSALNQRVNDYRISSSFGSPVGQISQQVNGYKVYSSLQGRMQTEGRMTIYQ